MIWPNEQSELRSTERACDGNPRTKKHIFRVSMILHFVFERILETGSDKILVYLFVRSFVRPFVRFFF